MFSFFKKTIEEQAITELKRLTSMMKEAGGAEKICLQYWHYLKNNDLYKQTGIAAADDAPMPPMLATLSALSLLNSWKSTPDSAGKDIKDLMLSLSERVYVASVTSLSAEDLKHLYAESTDEIEDPEQAEIRLRTEIYRRKSIATEAWSSWKSNDSKTLDFLTKN